MHNPPSALGAPRHTTVDALRSRIHMLERAWPGALEGDPRLPRGDTWTLGADPLDDLLGPEGLDPYAVHEIKPALPAPSATLPAAWASAHLFALALSIRRLQARTFCSSAAPLLWCASPAMSGEFGVPYGPGLQDLGQDAARVLLAEPRTSPELLCALQGGLGEEGLDGILQVSDDGALFL